MPLTLVIVASGPSLSAEQVALLQDPPVPVDIMAINLAHTQLPGVKLDYVYIGDYQVIHEFSAGVPCETQIWTQRSAPGYRLSEGRFHTVQGRQKARGLNLAIPDAINVGSNSGFQAIHLAITQLGYRRILLVAFDFQHTGDRSHSHGDHRDGLGNFASPAARIPHMIDLANDICHTTDAKVINCSEATALTCWPRLSLEEALRHEQDPTTGRQGRGANQAR